MNKLAVSVENVSMAFNLQKQKTDSLKEYCIKLFKRELGYSEFYALKNVSLTVNRGDSLAIIGANGSGKSTLLKLISGILAPTCGKITVNGSIAPLIELGSGFNTELTARENIYLNGALLGHNRKYMNHVFEEIMEFSELWDFVDVPVKNFSSGMQARLGFAIATLVKPEILIVDEILSVGDAAFKKKCENRMNGLLTKGTTLILVSHSGEQVKKMCENAIWLKKGEVCGFGKTEEVYDAYMKDVSRA